MTRNGKIARLPDKIRNQLNRRLQDGEPGNVLVEWLNKLPAVKPSKSDSIRPNPTSEKFSIRSSASKGKGWTVHISNKGAERFPLSWRIGQG